MSDFTWTGKCPKCGQTICIDDGGCLDCEPDKKICEDCGINEAMEGGYHQCEDCYNRDADEDEYNKEAQEMERCRNKHGIEYEDYS